MLLNGRITVDDQPDPVTPIISTDYDERPLEQLTEFFDDGYAATDDEIADSLVPDRSPVYSVEVLLPEDCLGERTFPEEAYVGTPVEDSARMQGLPEDSEEALRRLEDGQIYLMAVAHASRPDIDPEFKVADTPLEAELANREENVEAMNAVEKAVNGTEYEMGFPDYTIWTDSFSSPEEAVEQASGTEMKMAATLYNSTPFHVDVGYLSSPQEEGSQFGIEIRNKASEAVDRQSAVEARKMVQEVVDEMEENGFAFSDKNLQLEM